MKNTNKAGWRSFIKLCTELKTEERMGQFFDFFLTHKEKEDLGKRALIVQELLEGKRTQREIAKHLSLSISKITRGSNALKLINKNLREYLQKH
ncbi:MAG TPA: trp operon repressor [Rhabdochlamydiaceae bacterium]|nr:trp operon repressor [Rhabdochlamydiaceae bacterium]